MCTGSGCEIGLVDDNHIELLSKLMVQHLRLINAGLDLFIGLGGHQVLVWEFGIVDLVAILSGRTFARIGTLIDKM